MIRESGHRFSGKISLNKEVRVIPEKMRGRSASGLHENKLPGFFRESEGPGNALAPGKARFRALMQMSRFLTALRAIDSHSAAGHLFRYGDKKLAQRCHVAKAAINPPNCIITDPHYLAECRFALEPSFAGLVRLAEKAGWDRQQVTYSLMMLAAEALQASGSTSSDGTEG